MLNNCKLKQKDMQKSIFICIFTQMSCNIIEKCPHCSNKNICTIHSPGIFNTSVIGYKIMLSNLSRSRLINMAWLENLRLCISLCFILNLSKPLKLEQNHQEWSRFPAPLLNVYCFHPPPFCKTKKLAKKSIQLMLVIFCFTCGYKKKIAMTFKTKCVQT